MIGPKVEVDVGLGRLGRVMERHPAALLCGALGAGYIVGGGLGSRLGGQLLRLGGVLAWRLFLAPTLEQMARGFVGGVRTPLDEGAEGAPL